MKKLEVPARRQRSQEKNPVSISKMNKNKLTIILILLLSILFLCKEAEPSGSLNLSPSEKSYLLKTARNAIKAQFNETSKSSQVNISKSKSNISETERLKKIRCGVFITLEKWGKVRGCRGTLEPARINIINEVRHNAVAASMGDSRYPPFIQGSIDHCRISITIVEGLVPAKSLLSIKKSDGIVLRKGNNVGVVLPYEGSDPLVRLKWAYLKAGLEEPSPEDINDLTGVFILKGDRFADGELSTTCRPAL